jgi:sugar phosphate isomerase/epimerase
MAADCGIVLHSLHPYGLQRQGTLLFPAGTSQGDRGRNSLIRDVDACAAMGIPSLMISSFFATLVRNDWDFGVFTEQLSFACQYGADHGVQIVYESVLTPERILRMIEATGGSLRICYDTLNPIRWGTGNPQDEIPALGLEHIDHFHVKDAPNNLKGYAMLGEGRGMFFSTAQLIRQMGYSGWLVSENYYTLLSAASGEDFLQLARRDCRTLRAAFGE